MLETNHPALVTAPRRRPTWLPVRFLAIATAAAAAWLAAPAPASTAPLFDTIGGEAPLRIKSVAAKAEIGGTLAETTIRIVVANPNARPLEGKLRFPLLEGQTVSAFSLDIGGTMRAAVPVERAKGRRIVDESERRGIDPALLEQTGGNSFSLRVFPIPAGGTRIVEFTFTETLGRGPDGHRLAYRLPLAWGDAPFDLDLTLAVRGSEAAPAARPDAMTALSDLQFSRQGTDWIAKATKPAFIPGGSLDLLLAVSDLPKAFVSERAGETYFAAEIPLAVPSSARRVLPTHGVVQILWDASGSATSRDRGAELAVLGRFLAETRDATAVLTILRDRPEKAGEFAISGGDWSLLRKAIESAIPDGASALADWTPDPRAKDILLFSDGLITWGPKAFPAIAVGVRLDAITSSAGADSDLLAAAAEWTGGRLVSVDPKAPGAAAEALLANAPRISDLSAEGAGDLLVDTTSDGRVRVAGRLTAAAATIRLSVHRGGTDQAPLRIVLPISDATPRHAAAPSQWAAMKLRSLAADRGDRQAEIRRIGEKFSLPTRETSLLVLETAADYVRNDVAPPPDIEKQVAELRASREGALLAGRTRAVADAAALFATKVEWWEKAFDKSDHPWQTPKAGEPNRSLRLSGSPPPEDSASGFASPPAPTLALAPPPAPSVAMSDGARGSTAFDGANSDHSRHMAAKSRSSGGGGSPPLPDAPQMASDAQATIAVKRWTPNAPYATRMQAAATAEAAYAAYLDERPSWESSSAFFLDAADILFEKKAPALALRVLSNLAEMDLGNRAVLRILAHRLMQAERPDLAIPVLGEVLRLAEDEPQSFRDLGLALAAAGQRQKAVDALAQVVARPWDGRTPGIEIVALAELNAIAAASPEPLDLSAVDPRLRRNLPLALRVVMDWDADDTDMDLWVTDPNGEKCFYQNRITYQGGRLPDDVTQGYGPEEFSLRRAKPGTYTIEANFYGNRQQLVAGATTVHVRLTTGFGTSAAKDKDIVLRLKERGGTILVGTFDVK